MSFSARHKLVPIAKDVARELRRKATPAEKIFWEQVRNRRFLGLKFYRQYQFFVDVDGRETFYVADFYCHEKRIAVELDGLIHLRQKEHDALREDLIRDKGIQVKRFKNEEVETDIQQVMHQLKSFVQNEQGKQERGFDNPSLLKRGAGVSSPD